jgi:hypothetical protein
MSNGLVFANGLGETSGAGMIGGGASHMVTRGLAASGSLSNCGRSGMS